ncbi:MAG: 3D domain-containing protein [Firmicutes bacterium]|nr:3D domain-containing protein [Bacillota bacterium]
MLECSYLIRKKKTVLARAAALLLPIVCIVLLLAQTVFAKNTYLINDGGRVLIHTTYATDPADVLDEAGLKLGRDDTYTTQNSLGMSEITIQRRQTVTILYGGKTLTVATYGETVESLLNRMEFRLTENDTVSEAMSAMTYDGMTLTISREITEEETYTLPVAYETEYCYDASLAEGQQVVLTQGAEGQIRYTASVHYVDGREVSRTVTSETLISQPVNALIAIGSLAELPEYAPTPEIVEPEPVKPAEPKPEPAPEATPTPGTPIIGDGIIITPDGETLTYTRAEQFVATAYHNSDPGCTEWTATGTLCRVGAIAVDPKVIPYGTRMYIVTNDGEYIYGIAVAEDCGGAIKGNRVDLYFDSVDECWTFGIRDCTIYFLG